MAHALSRKLTESYMCRAFAAENSPPKRTDNSALVRKYYPQYTLKL